MIVTKISLYTHLQSNGEFNTEDPINVACNVARPCLVPKNFYKNFQIFCHVEYCGICMKHYI